MMERPWLQHYPPGVPRTLVPYADETLIDVLAASARSHPDAPALLFKKTRVTYAALDRASNAFAAALSALGVRRGDRVALILPNCPQFLVAEFGAWKVGAIVCPLNPTYTEREITDALVLTGAETVVVLNRFYEKVKTLQRATSVRRVIATNIKEYFPPALKLAFTLLVERKEGDRITPRDGDARMVDLIARHASAAAPAGRIDSDAPATILLSGGTTGTPKGVLGSHRNAVISGRQLAAWLRPIMREWTDTFLLPLPLFHTYANTGLQSLALVNHNPIALIPNPRDMKDVLKEIGTVRPAFICAVPTLLNGIMNHPAARKVDFTSIRMCFSGASALMAETKRRFEELTGGIIMEGYSLTEAQMAVVANPAVGERKTGSVGMPLPDVDIRIVNGDDGVTAMPAGEVGEIVFSAPQLMQGYWPEGADGEMIRTGPTGERLLYTGDLGYLDGDGYLFIVDRKKDLIKTSGFQVWPREVEEVLSSHPAVAEVGVAGLPDQVRGESVGAWVVLRPGTTATPAELKVWCRERLAPYKVPATFDFVSDLPKSQVGKVLRRLLREQATPSTSGST
ncbi:MAG: AMP-binding protein [Gemmatimonadales bacterium]|nr:AMP-binding protein [Gemmatimonadales bacterium]